MFKIDCCSEMYLKLVKVYIFVNVKIKLNYMISFFFFQKIKMATRKTHMNVDELQNLCENLNLPTDGFKEDLIARILNFSNSSSSSTSESTSIISPTKSQSTQTEDQPTPTTNNNNNKMELKFFKISFWKSIAVFGLIGGCFAALQLPNFYEKKEIIEKRSFFQW